jgi:hypothetical protein
MDLGKLVARQPAHRVRFEIVREEIVEAADHRREGDLSPVG